MIPTTIFPRKLILPSSQTVLDGRNIFPTRLPPPTNEMVVPKEPVAREENADKAMPARGIGDNLKKGGPVYKLVEIWRVCRTVVGVSSFDDLEFLFL